MEEANRYVNGEDVFYYVTIHNENYVQPARPEDVDEGILAGMYRFRESPLSPGDARHRVQLFGSGSILATQVLRAQELLAEYHVEGAANFDWESLAIDGEGRLYIGDVGNNIFPGGLRRRVIYRVPEPDPRAAAG